MAHTAFLRASSQASNADVDITTIASGADPKLPFGQELAVLAQEMGTNWIDPPVASRTALIAAAGEAVAERAIGVAATFQMMNRLLDGVGAPVNPGLHPLAQELGFDPESIPR